MLSELTDIVKPSEDRGDTRISESTTIALNEIIFESPPGMYEINNANLIVPL